MPFRRKQKLKCCARANVRMYLGIAAAAMLGFFLVGFGVAADHEGKLTVLGIPDLLAVVLCGTGVVLLTYTVVADDAIQLIFKTIQLSLLLGMFCISIAVGKVGVTVANCSTDEWASPEQQARHHCAASILQFSAGIAHTLLVIAILFENIDHLSNDDYPNITPDDFG